MAYRSIAALITSEATDSVVLTAAAELAQQEDAHLDVVCLAVERTRQQSAFPYADLAISHVAFEAARETALSLRSWALDQLADRMPSAVVEPVLVPDAGLEAGLARIVRYADLVVSGRPEGQPAGSDTRKVLEAALFGAETAVVVVGLPAADLQEPPGRVLVAWDESAEALSAIRRALPFLKAARHVDIVMVDPPVHSPERSDPGGPLSVMLARHGVRAEISILSRTLPRVADVLLRFAEERGCEMIVMGAYGHSRLREAVLGGPTRDMLDAAHLPLLLAH